MSAKIQHASWSAMNSWFASAACVFWVICCLGVRFYFVWRSQRQWGTNYFVAAPSPPVHLTTRWTVFFEYGRISRGNLIALPCPGNVTRFCGACRLRVQALDRAATICICRHLCVYAVDVGLRARCMLLCPLLRSLFKNVCTWLRMPQLNYVQWGNSINYAKLIIT